MKKKKCDSLNRPQSENNLIPHVCNQASAAEISLGGYAPSETHSAMLISFDRLFLPNAE